LTLVGFAPNVPGVEAATAVPVSETLGAAPDAVEVNETIPEELPAAVGVKTTLKLLLAPAANEKGSVSPLRLKPVPLIVTCETLTELPPVLVTVTVCFRLLPTCTLLNVRLATETARAPGDGAGLLLELAS
jgi:hypothetical protein